MARRKKKVAKGLSGWALKNWMVWLGAISEHRRAETRLRAGWRGKKKCGARSCSSVGYPPADTALSEAHTCSDEHLHPSQGHRRSDALGRLCYCEASFLLKTWLLPHFLQTPDFVSSAGAGPRMEIYLSGGSGVPKTSHLLDCSPSGDTNQR